MLFALVSLKFARVGPTSMYSLTYNLVLQLAYTFYCNKTCIIYARFITI